MSEKQRKKRWWRSVAAVVSTVVLGIGGVAVPQTAGAYVAGSGEETQTSPRDETGPSATLDVTAPERIQPGENFVITIHGTANAPYPAGEDGPAAGESNIRGSSVFFLLPPSEVAERRGNPTITLDTGESWEVTIKDLPDGAQLVDLGDIGSGAKFDLDIPLRATGEDGDKVDFPALVQARIEPEYYFSQVGNTLYRPIEGTSCDFTGRSTHRLNSGEYGAFLSEIWLGTRNRQDVQLGESRITVTVGGEDRTEEVMNKAFVNAEQRETLDEEERDKRYPNTLWSTVYDWPLDRAYQDGFEIPSETKGAVWLPARSEVTIEQVLRLSSRACADVKERGGSMVGDQVAFLSAYRPDIVYNTSEISKTILIGEKPESSTVVTPPQTVTTTETTTEFPEPVTTTVTTTPSTTATTTQTVVSTATTTPTKTELTTTTEQVPTTTTKQVPTTTTEVVPTTTTKQVPTTTTEVVPTTTTETTTVSTPCDCEPETVTKTETAKPVTETRTETTTVMEPVPTTTTKTEKVPEPVPTTIHTTTTAEPVKLGRIGDRVWVDENGDGKEDPDEKTGVPGVTVVIKDKDGNEVTRTVTDENGNWKVDVEPGEYTVHYEPGDRTPSDKEQVERTITIKPGEENFDVDLGILPSGSVGDRVWNDEDGDGEQGEDEKGLENVVVLVSREGEPTRTAVTDENGDWKIEGLNPNAAYDIRFIKPEGWEVTGKVPGSDESGLVSKVTVKPNEYNDSYDLGLKKVDPGCDCEPVKPGTIGDRVWIDLNGNGKEDPDEKTGVPGVTVIVKDPDGNEVTRTVTDEDGNWKVDVEPGEYTVRYEPGDRTPSDPELVERTIVIEPGENRDDIDLGILPSGSVGDRVWNDEDGDGKQGEDEKGLENVVVLVSREGEPTRSAVTDENGDWKIEGLNPNAEYDIRFIKPEGWEVTGKVPGSDESGFISKVTVKPNEYNDSYDLGLKKTDVTCDCEPVKPGRIGDRVWIDHNGDGKQDPNETEGAPDVTVIVRDKDGNEVTRTVTDEDGNWKVDVEPGDYEIEYRPRDWKPTDPKRVTQTVTVEEGKDYLDLDLGVQKPKPDEPTPPTEKPEKGSSSETLDRCVANAVRSPLLYLVPVALLGAFGGEIARPYMGAINEQVNQINAQFQEAMRRNSPDWGHGGRGGRDNDQFAELRGQIDAANRRIAELGQDPNVQRFGTVAAGIIGLIAAGGVLYDWCSNEKGEAFTSIGGSSAEESGAEGRQSSSKDAA